MSRNFIRFAIPQSFRMSFRIPFHMPFRKAIPPFTFTDKYDICILFKAKFLTKEARQWTSVKEVTYPFYLCTEVKKRRDEISLHEHFKQREAASLRVIESDM